MSSRRANLYIGLVICAGAAILAHGLWNWTGGDFRKYLTYSVIALIASGMKISLPSVKGTMSMSFLFVLIGIATFSLGETLVMGCLGIVVQTVFLAKSRPQPVRVAFNVASMACAIQVAYSVHHAWELQNTLLTASTFFVANTFLIAAVIAVTEEKNVLNVWRDSYFWSFPNYLVGAAAAWLVSEATRFLGWQPALLLMPIFYVVYRSHNLYIGKLEEAKRRAEEQRAHAVEIAGLQRRSIETLALAVEAKDQTTHDHLERVEVYAVEVAKELGLSETEIEALRAAALLHDIGKLAIPEYIISKPGKLTPEEFEKMKTHTVVGSEIVERIRFPYAVAPMVRGHHEKWNGSGYPDGLAGEQIPIGARILAAVDTLDALASDRQYRRAMPIEKAIGIIKEESGKSFDPRIVEILARRYQDLDQLARNSHRIERLPTEVRVERGDAPAAGFEKTAADLMQFHSSIADTRKQAVDELAAAMPQCETREAVFSAMRSHLPRVVAYRTMAIYTRRAEILVAEGVDGDGFGSSAADAIPLGAGLSGWVAENGKAIVNGNPAVEPGYLNDPAKFAALRSALSVPLITDRGIIGVLSLYSEEDNAYGNQHLEALNAIGSALARALELTAQREQAA
ncbi:MAG: HD domain-containing protein [Acidobacteriia bacterium]|nr:HD domain-containing protein [Terriglobia bacterium]